MKTSNFFMTVCIQAFAYVALITTSYAFDLNGAWTTMPVDCDKTFAKTGNAISFKANSDSDDSGFIVEGNAIVGRAGRCTIKTRKEEGATIQIVASCTSEIMVDQEKFSVKVANDDTIVRVFPSVLGMETTFSRCKFNAR